MSKNKSTDLSPVVKEWLNVGIRILLIILSAIAGDATDIINLIP